MKYHGDFQAKKIVKFLKCLSHLKHPTILFTRNSPHVRVSQHCGFDNPPTQHQQDNTSIELQHRDLMIFQYTDRNFRIGIHRHIQLQQAISRKHQTLKTEQNFITFYRQHFSSQLVKNRDGSRGIQCFRGHEPMA